MHIKHLLKNGEAAIGTAAPPKFVAEATPRGAFALSGMTEKVIAELVVRETGLAVPAHAVFVSTDDPAYVHARAMAANAPKGSHTLHGSYEDPKAAIPTKLMLHATLPRGGQYPLWIQFKGSSQVRTVPFFITVPAAP